MSILNIEQQEKNNMMHNDAEGSKKFGSDVMGLKNAIKNFVEAKKAEEAPVEKGKKGIIKSAIKKVSK